MQAARPPTGCCVLVVEDEYMIATGLVGGDGLEPPTLSV